MTWTIFSSRDSNTFLSVGEQKSNSDARMKRRHKMIPMEVAKNVVAFNGDL